MARPVADPTLTRAEFRLGKKSLDAADYIAREFARRTRRPGNRTEAVRWALAELRARIELGRKAAGGVVLTVPGPMVPPP